MICVCFRLQDKGRMNGDVNDIIVDTPIYAVVTYEDKHLEIATLLISLSPGSGREPWRERRTLGRISRVLSTSGRFDAKDG